jgi:hypothetical protein
MRRRGALLREIADVMNAAGQPTPAGRPHWQPINVSNLLGTWGAEQLRAQLDRESDAVPLTAGTGCGRHPYPRSAAAAGSACAGLPWSGIVAA